MPALNNSLPYEIIAAPFTVWFAAVGTAFPLVSAAPSASWAKVGSSGDLNYMEDGVTVQHSQAIELFRALGDSGSRKAFRTEEDLKVMLVLADLTLEQYKHALNSNTITTVAQSVGVAGHKKIGMSRGLSVATVALLVRGPSPYMDDGVLQFEVPRAAQTGNPEVVFRRDQPAGLALEWTALVDPDASSEDERFGRLRAQTTDVGT
jgi:hypothetical protein